VPLTRLSTWQGALLLTARESAQSLSHQVVRPEIGRVGEGEEEMADLSVNGGEESSVSDSDLAAAAQRAYKTRLDEQMAAFARDLAGCIMCTCLSRLSAKAQANRPYIYEHKQTGPIFVSTSKQALYL